jgi:hypothetical protein
MTRPDRSWQGHTITDRPVPQLLRTRQAVVLERLARGGGATNWYHCPDHAHLDAITAELRPGSLVSFYFDDRITHCRYTAEVHRRVLQLIHSLRDAGDSGEIVFGQLAVDGLHIQVDYPSGPEYLDEITQTLGSHSWIYYGPYPGRDNDGIHAVTLTLPDPDGITRAHPY